MNKIENFFERLYSPINKFLPNFVRHLENLDDGKYKDTLAKIGSVIPRSCVFKSRFNLSWRPCVMNPFYLYLMELSLWSSKLNEKEKIAQIMANLNIQDQYLEEEN